jgi:hypothetical protein
MTTATAGTFAMKTWEESSYTAEDAFPRLATVQSENTYSGLIEAETVLRYVIIYLSDTQGTFTGMQTFTGSVAGKAGSFTVQEEGGWDGTTVTGRYTVVPGSGTGELTGITGSGEYTAVHGESAYPYTFEYRLEGA